MFVLLERSADCKPADAASRETSGGGHEHGMLDGSNEHGTANGRNNELDNNNSSNSKNSHNDNINLLSAPSIPTAPGASFGDPVDGARGVGFLVLVVLQNRSEDAVLGDGGRVISKDSRHWGLPAWGLLLPAVLMGLACLSRCHVLCRFRCPQFLRFHLYPFPSVPSLLLRFRSLSCGFGNVSLLFPLLRFRLFLASLTCQTLASLVLRFALHHFSLRPVHQMIQYRKTPYG